MKISLQELFDMEDDQLKLEHGRTPDTDSWRWSPFDIFKFDVMLHVAYDYLSSAEPHRLQSTSEADAFSFGEAGSGIGTKLYLAKHKYLMTEYGYEINDD